MQKLVYQYHQVHNKHLFREQKGQYHKYNFHFNIFDNDSLFDQLLSAGFIDPEVWDWRMTEHSHIDDFSQAYIPHMAKSTGTLSSYERSSL